MLDIFTKVTSPVGSLHYVGHKAKEGGGRYLHLGKIPCRGVSTQ